MNDPTPRFLFGMGEEHNVVFGQGPKVDRATRTLPPSPCLMRHEEKESALVDLLTVSPCPKIYIMLFIHFQESTYTQ